ncbi:hypothetical protein [Nonomuraea sp. NPDC049480]
MTSTTAVRVPRGLVEGSGRVPGVLAYPDGAAGGMVRCGAA